jgi:flavin-dependent dehydrogenase
VIDIDMRALVTRLQAEAIAAGAKIIAGVRALRVERGVLWTNAGTIAARWFVDASGAAGARLLDQRHEPGDLCSAAQELRAVTDLRRARAFFEAHGALAGDTLCFTSVAGGYSIVSARLIDDGVSLLTGSLPEHGHPSGASLLARFVAEHAWIGERVFGGARAIPLAPPSALAADSVALLGDAGGQVFPAHGSGVGVGLVAARLLADALASGAGTRGYAAAYRRRFGLLHAAYGALRRVSSRLSPRDLEEMIDARLLDERTLRAAIEQRWPSASLARALPSVAAALSRPRLLRRVIFPPRALPSPR